MADLVKKITIGAPFSNEVSYVRTRYSFADDGGASGTTYTIAECDGAVIVKDFFAVVKTACTSPGSMVLDVGIAGSTTDDDRFLANVAVASLTANSVHKTILVEGTPNVETVPLYLADGDTITMDIDADTLTAGVIEFVIGVMKP